MFFKKDKERLDTLESKVKQIDLFEEKIALLDELIEKLVSKKGEEIEENVNKKVSDCQELISRNYTEFTDKENEVANKVFEITSQMQKDFKSELLAVNDKLSKIIEERVSSLEKKIGQFSLRYDNLFNELKLANEKILKDANEKGVTFKKYIDTCILSVNKTLEDTDRKLLAVNDKEASNYQQINKKIESAVGNFNSLYLASDRKTGDLSKEVSLLNTLKAEILNIKTSVQSNKDVSAKNLSSVESEIKNLSLKLIDAKDIENKLNTKLCFLSKQIQYDVSAGTDKKMSDFKKDINEEYYKALQKIFEFNKKILEQAPVKVTDESIEKLRKDLSQKLLEAKWAKQKAETGNEITNKGVEIINKRKELHEEMLRKEKQGGKVEGMKEQIKAFDWMIERVKK